MPLPHFFVVGVPKAGTTALYNYLNQHPRIYLPEVKEPHYFSYAGEAWPHWGVKTLEDYQSLFQSATDNQIIGEASTWYLYSTTAAEQIHQQLPDSKIIVMLRQPVERAYSSWAFRIQCGWEPVQDFEQALRIEPDRIQSDSDWDFHYASTGFYYPQLKRYFDLFPKEQIRVYLQEDLKQNTASVVEDVFQFLGIEASCDLNFETSHNVTHLPRKRAINQFLIQQNPLKSFVKAVMPNRLRHLLATQLRTFNQTKVPTLPKATKQRLTQQYRQDIQATEHLIERDLSGWLQEV